MLPIEGASLYAVLGVSPDASDEQIRRAYRQLATVYHPDKTRDPSMREEASRMFTQIQEAYEVSQWCTSFTCELRAKLPGMIVGVVQVQSMRRASTFHPACTHLYCCRSSATPPSATSTTCTGARV
jgi:hypothetical protein